MKRERLIDIDQAKGLAILLVVIGHITLSSSPQNADWYETLRQAIYKFHMPLFMYLSGYTMYYTLPKLNSFNEYMLFVKKKALRLLPPLILFGLAIGIGKYTFSGLMVVDGVPQFSWYEFLKIIINPTQSFASSIWYIYVLFLFYLAIPLFITVFRDRLVYILGLGVLIHFWMPTPLFAINSFNEYLLYLSLGMLSVKYRNEIVTFYDKYCYPLLAIFLISFGLMLTGMGNYHSKTIISLLSIPAIHALIRKKVFINNTYLVEYAKYTFVIYLLNTIFIGLTKGIILKFVSWDGINFFFVAPILVLTGLYGPILLKKYIFSGEYGPLLARRYVLPKIKFLDRMTN